MSEQQRSSYTPRAGDSVTVPGMAEPFAVVDVHFPLVTLRNQHGQTFRVGWKAIEPVETAA